ncbi:MAG: family 1 glycosylhydrolase, partial [Pseudorhodobacter sp.]
APGLRDIRAAARAMHQVCLAHGTAVAALRARGIGNIGAVCNFEYAHAADDSPAALAAARLYDGIYNRWFVQAFCQGSYPEDVLEGLAPHLPHGWQDDMAAIAAPLDWLGLNYYTCKRIAPTPGPWPALAETGGPLPKTAMGWEIDPQGLGHFLRRIHRDHAPGLPLYITENGMASPDQLSGGTVADQDRIAYLAAHLAEVRGAIAGGVPVKGYFCWSLLDNYEWALGYDKRFGLVHVDFESLQRTPKASYHALSRALSRPLA